MGNCQATDAATVIIRHPGGKLERLHWPTLAGVVMRSNPGYFVALVTLCAAEERQNEVTSDNSSSIKTVTVRYNRVRLLKPKDTLLLGNAYRLVSSQEVTKALQTRKNEKLKRAQQQKEQQELSRKRDGPDAELTEEARPVAAEKTDQRTKQEGDRKKSSTPSVRARQWRPSLQSILEAGS